MITSLPTSVFQRYPSEKHFCESGLPVQRDQLRAQRWVTSMGKLYPLPFIATKEPTVCIRVCCMCKQIGRSSVALSAACQGCVTPASVTWSTSCRCDDNHTRLVNVTPHVTAPYTYVVIVVKVKVAHTRLPSVGFRS